MKNIVFVFIFIGGVISYSVSCAPEFKKDTDTRANTKIRYVNLKKISDFLDNRSPEYSRIYLEIKRHQSEIERTQRFSENYEKLNAELESLEKELNDYKRQNYQLIQGILEQISNRHQIDFILQYSEHVIYAKQKFDITDEVIREIIKLEQRQSIINR